MKLPLSWLQDFVDLNGVTTQEISEKLVSIGFEVEETTHIGAEIDKVVVGKILDVKEHVDSNKLFVCMVDVGSEIINIVSGATNLTPNAFVPVALDGATVFGGKKIVSAPLRGVMSYGMMCSGKELGIDNYIARGADVDGILLFDSNEFPDMILGQDVKEMLELEDYVFDISLTANRPDCQSIYGLAREIAILFDLKLKSPLLKYKVKDGNARKISVTIEDKTLCPKYKGAIIENIVIEPSPKWLARRLRLVGHKPINNIVDITNYVLTEVGQPMHAFDADKLVGNINVRRAVDGEKIEALDGNTYSLSSNMLAICDDEAPRAIAGVMGGTTASVSATTHAIFFESARFARSTVRSTSRALGLRSDSSARYEKGVDFMSVDIGLMRALALISLTKAGNIVCDDIISGVDEPEQKVIRTSVSQINSILGIDIKKSIISKILKSLEIEVENKDDDTLVCKIPRYREDIDNYTDLAEEVIRFYGYDNIKSTYLESSSVTVGGISDREKEINEVKSILCSLGAYEVTTYSFINAKESDMLSLPKDDYRRNIIEIKKPLSEDYAVMRTQMIGSMLSTLALNLSRKNTGLKFFEVGKNYIPLALPLVSLPREYVTLSIGLCDSENDFYVMKNMFDKVMKFFGLKMELQFSKEPYLHPGKSADIMVNGVCLGSFGELHPLTMESYEITQKVCVGELNLEPLINMQRTVHKYTPLPKYPAIMRDLAIIVDDSISAGEALKTIAKVSGEYCENVTLFDVFTGSQIEKGKKSLAFNLTFRASDRTLTDGETQTKMTEIIDILQKECNATLR